MDKRTGAILAAIVDGYIKTGEPVGSKTLAMDPEIGVSSATIRNTMAALERDGFLGHPHTSAGRVPTYKGFRYYIENLMSPEPPGEESISEIDKRLMSDVSDKAIVENASAALAEITKCAVVSTNHVSQFSVITKVDVIPTGKRMYVVLMIASNGTIKNKVCRMEFDVTNEQITQFSEFLNAHLTGVGLTDVSKEMLDGMTDAFGAYTLSLAPLVNGVCDLFEEMRRGSVDVKGETNLLACTDIPMEDVLRFIESKSELSQLLDGAFSGINIRFGEESGTFAISNSTVVSANYYKDGKPAGTIGVVGPMRLDYRKVIPYIEYLSRRVTQILSNEDGAALPNGTEGDTKNDE